MHRNDFKRLFNEAFTVDKAWSDWFVQNVFDEDEALSLEIDGKTVSGLLMTPYAFAYQGAELPSAYISCVATARKERGKGLMHRLMHKAIVEGAERGYAFLTLIPSSRRLYFFYDQFGFSTVFYINEERYTSLHVFESEGYEAVEPSYGMFHALELGRPCAVRHSERQFVNVLKDMELSGGAVVAVSDGSGSDAMAFAEIGSEVKVLDLLSSDEKAAEAALAALRAKAGEKPFIVRNMPAQVASDDTRRGASLRARGMLRVANVEMALSALASANPQIDQVIKVSDPIIGANNSIFTLHGGECRRTPDTLRHLTLDIPVDVLSRLLFSAPSIGDIFTLPATRPFISLMLD